MIVPVILSGGSGTRLWPMSRPEMPKQMLALTADQTMLQLTAARTSAADGFARPIIVANARHAALIEQQLSDIGVTPDSIILEPAGRNTAPAIALAAVAAGGGDTMLLVMPSDHVITDVPAFHAAIKAAQPLVEQGWLCTFGIAPDAPETGYGWIKIGDAIAEGVHRVDRFVEKPPRDRAEAMLASGDHSWNGGIFLFRADSYMAALDAFAPAIATAARTAIARATRSGVMVAADPEAFMTSPSDSIDYAVMEKADRVAVAPVAMGWSDVGSWDALYTISARDENGNAASGNVIALDTRNCLIKSDQARITLVGVEDLIVVVSGQDVMILPRGKSQDVKRIVAALPENQ